MGWLLCAVVGCFRLMQYVCDDATAGTWGRGQADAVGAAAWGYLAAIAQACVEAVGSPSAGVQWCMQTCESCGEDVMKACALEHTRRTWWNRCLGDNDGEADGFRC